MSELALPLPLSASLRDTGPPPLNLIADPGFDTLFQWSGWDDGRQTAMQDTVVHDGHPPSFKVTQLTTTFPFCGVYTWNESTGPANVVVAGRPYLLRARFKAPAGQPHTYFGVDWYVGTHQGAGNYISSSYADIATTGDWQTVELQLVALSGAGAVSVGFYIDAAAGIGAHFNVDDVELIELATEINLIPNPDFDTLDGWFGNGIPGTQTLTLDTVVHDGHPPTAKVTAITAASWYGLYAWGSADVDANTPPFPVVAGTTYLLRARIRGPAGQPHTAMGVDFYRSLSDTFRLGHLRSDDLVLTGSWQTVEFQATAPPDAGAGGAVFYMEGTEVAGGVGPGAYFNLDDVEFVAIDEPVSPPLYLAPDTFAARLYAMLAPLAQQDPAWAWALLTLCNAIGLEFQLVEELVRDTAAGEPGWSLLVDLDRCPDVALPWLGQFVGVRVLPGSSPDEQRARIASTDGFRRGTTAALIGAVKATLTGQQHVLFKERDHVTTDTPNYAYYLTVVTYAAETPDVMASRNALLAQKPGGIILNFSSVTAQTYDTLRLTNTNYAAVNTKYPSYGAALVDLPF